MSSPTLHLNGVRLTFSADTFTAYAQRVDGIDTFRDLRTQLGEEWFLYWIGGMVYGLPQSRNPESSFGEPILLTSDDHLQLLAARITDALPAVFPRYEAFRRRPFVFLTQRQDLVTQIAQRLDQPSKLLERFKIRPRYELDARLVEPQDGSPFVGLFQRVGMRWEIQASVLELVEAGIDIRGLYVVRREPAPDERRLVGKIERVSDTTVFLSESYDSTLTNISNADVWLEGSRASFAHCLKTILGSQFQRFESERYREEEGFFTGPAVDTLTEKFASTLQKVFPLSLAPDLTCSVDERIAIRDTDSYQSVVKSAPVQYCFDAARTKRQQFPWNGIEKYGPFSRDTFAKKSPRILVLFPDTVQGPVESFLRGFRDGVLMPGAPSHYVGGFAKAFGLVNPEFILCRVPWLGESNRDPVRAYRQTVETFLAGPDPLPDAALVIVLDEHAQLPDTGNPYLHSKALLLMAGVPVQHARLSTISKRAEELQYICQNIAVALYAKMNGTPWTVDNDLTINDELIIGMGTAELSGIRFEKRQRFIGVTTVFRGDGNYLLTNLSKECGYDDYPAVLQETTISALRDIKERNGWRAGDTVRIVFHAFKPLRRVEIAPIVSRCVGEVGSEQNVEFAFLTIAEDHPFRVFDRSQRGRPTRRGSGPRKGQYVPERGLILQIGRYSRLLCANGPSMVKRAGAPLPAPLLVHPHRESTYRDLTYLTEQALKFTSLSWRSMLPASKPVTMYYSELIAELLARLRGVPDWSPAMLNIKLRASRWFL